MVVEGEQGEEKGVKLINKSVDQQLNSLLGAKKRLDIRNLASLFNYQMFCLSINIPHNSVTKTLVPVVSQLRLLNSVPLQVVTFI